MMASAKLPLLLSAVIAAVGLAAGCTRNASVSNFEAQINPKSTPLSGIIGGMLPGPNHAITKSVVLIYSTGQSIQGLCTATLLTKEYALTAAHCLENINDVENPEGDQLYLVFGNKLSPQSPRRKIIKAQRDYTRERLPTILPTDAYDIAVVKFAGGLPPGYQPATLLPEQYESNFKVGTTAVLAGYGIDNYENGTVDTLRFADVKIANPKISTMEVLMDQTNGKGSCKGDSGGPAFFYIGGKFYLWGVASHGGDIRGKPVSDCGQYVLYTNALIFRYAINKMMAQMSAAPSLSLEAEMSM